VAYRAIFDAEASTASTARLFDQDLNAWAKVDQITYGGIGVDDFVFTLDTKGARFR
jgi:hypothetical protein